MIVTAQLGLLVALAACSPAQPPMTPVDIELVETRVDLGHAVAGGYVSGAMQIRAGDQGGVVAQISPSCGCTIVDGVTPASLKSGEILRAPVALDLSRLPDQGKAPGAEPRIIERTVSIVSEKGTRLTATLVATVSGLFHLEPAQARFVTVVPGRQARVDVAVTGPPAPRIAGVETGRDDLAWIPGSAPDRGILEWSPAAAGDLEAFVTLRLDDARAGELRLRVTGRAESPLSVDPESIENLDALATRPVIARITLQRRDGLPLEILGVSCTAHRVETEIAPGSGPVRTVRVLVPVLALPAEIQGVVMIRTNVEGAEVVEVPVRVRGRT